MSLQRHKHKDTCYRGKKASKICRFGYPLPVMPKTMVLKPLEDEDKTDFVKENSVKVQKLMYTFYKKSKYMTFSDILKKLNMSELDYIKAIRYGITSNKIFLINCYNSNMWSLFTSNMDLQYILDPFSCATYIINYISKVEGGLSRLLKEAASDISN